MQREANYYMSNNIIATYTKWFFFFAWKINCSTSNVNFLSAFSQLTSWLATAGKATASIIKLMVLFYCSASISSSDSTPTKSYSPPQQSPFSKRHLNAVKMKTKKNNNLCAKCLCAVILTVILSSKNFRGNVIGSTTESACCVTRSQSLLQKQK